MGKPAADQGPIDGVLRIGARRTARHADAAELASGFSALGRPGPAAGAEHPRRLARGEVCVCDFVEPLAKSQPTVSHHLRVLSEAGLVQGDRRGKWVWYSLNRARLAELRAAIDEPEAGAVVALGPTAILQAAQLLTNGPTPALALARRWP